MDAEQRTILRVILIGLGAFAFIWWFALCGHDAFGGVSTMDRVRMQISTDADSTGDSCTIHGDTVEYYSSSVLKGLATIFGSGTVFVVDNDTSWFKYDSSSTDVVIWFSAHSAGIKWNSTTDKLQYTNDNSTWTDIGSGSGTTWNWEDSSGQEPFWVDSATYATVAGSVGGESDPTLTDDGIVTIGSGTKSEDTLFFDASSNDAIIYYNGPNEYFLANKNFYGSSRFRAGSGYDIRATFYSDYDGGGPILLGANSADSAGVTWGSLTALSYGTKANIHDSLDAHWTVFITDENDTVTAYRAAVHDSLIDHWATFTTDNNDTVTSYRAAAHDTLWANTPGYLTSQTDYSWAVEDSAAEIWIWTYDSVDALTDTLIGDSIAAHWTAWVSDNNDTVTAYRAAIHDTIVDHWAVFTTDNNDTVTSYRAAVHDSLVDHWTAFTTDENDTVTSYRAAAHDTLWANTPGYALLTELNDSLTPYFDSAEVTDEIEAKIKNGLEIYNKIDTTLAKIPTTGLADSSITIRVNSIDSTNIVDGSIGYGDLHTNSVVSGNIIDGSLIGADIADASVLEVDLGIENSPTDEYVLIYDSDNATLKMEWREVAPKVDTAYGALRHLAVDAVRDSGFLEELNVEDSAHVLDDYFLNEEGDTCTGDLTVLGKVVVDSVGTDFTMVLIKNANGAYIGGDDDSNYLMPRDSVIREAGAHAGDSLWANTPGYLSGTPQYWIKATLMNPNGVFATHWNVCLDPMITGAITIDTILVTCDADPDTELDVDLMWASAFIGLADSAVVDELNTTSGTTAIYSGFDDATVASGKCLYLRFNAEPDAAIKSMTVKIGYTFD